MKTFFLAITILGLTISGCNSSKEANLRFNLKKGKAYVYSMSLNIDQEMEGNKMNSDMNFGYTLDVIDDSSGVKTLKTSYDRIEMNMKTPGEDIRINTDKPLADTNVAANPISMMTGMFHAMKGKSFLMKVNPEGKILEVSGLKDMAEAMVNGMNIPEQSKPMMLQMFSSQFNDEMMKNNFAQAFDIFPNKPVKVGDTWEKKLSFSGMSMNTNYTVKEIGKDKVTLDARSTLQMQGSKGTQTGTFVVDRETGLVVDGNFEQKFEAPNKMIAKGKITGKER